jgi:hypothetical protein
LLLERKSVYAIKKRQKEKVKVENLINKIGHGY